MERRFFVNSPIDNKVIAELDYMGFEETKSAISKAHAAFEAWKNKLPKVRADILEKWYLLANSHKQDIAEILSKEQGKPTKEAIKEVEYGNSFIKFYAQEILRVFGEVSPNFQDNQWFINILEPIGVVGAITPWNFPCAMITKKVAPALAAGCPIVLKPSEETPLTAIKLRELAIEAGVPEEVFSIVYGNFKEIGEALLESEEIKMISFTGSVKVGKYLMEKSAQSVKKLVLELGGNAPCIVCEDADLNLAVKKIIQGKLRNAGQACTSPNRIFVNQNILEDFTKLLIKELQDTKPVIGPLINQQAKNKASLLVKEAIDKGAEIIFQEELKNNMDLYFPITVMQNLNDDMQIVKDEAFAPIFSILSFKDISEVIKRSNNTNYGLAAYIFSSDLKLSLMISKQINFGVIGVNEASTASDVTVHGGFNESGIGREGGRAGLLEYFENKFIIF